MKNIPLYEVRPIQDLRDMIRQSASLYGDKPVFLVKDPRAIGQQSAAPQAGRSTETRSAPYLPVSYKKYARDIDALGTWFFAQSLQGSRIAILAETRYEWYVTYLATVNGTGIVVPLDKELPQAEIANLLNRAKADVLVYASSKQKEVDAIRSSIGTVKTFIAMDSPTVAGDL